MKGKITIIDGNDQITLSEVTENVKAYMVKGEPGNDGISPTATVSKTGDVATISVTDKNGTTETTVVDGYNPTVTTTESTGKVDIVIDDIDGEATTTISDPVVNLSKSNHVATISVTDKSGTRSVNVADGADLTDGAVPTGAVIGFDGNTVPGGFEEVSIEVSTAGTDLNDYINDGVFFFKVANTPTNKPSNATNAAGYLQVIKRRSSDVLQIWFVYNRSEIFTRQMTEGTWRSWYRIQTGTEFIQCTLNADYTVQANNTEETLPFKTIINQSGTKLSVNDNSEIVIGAGISKIKVAGQIYFFTGTTGAKTINIKKNNSLLFRRQSPAPYEYLALPIPSTIINVAQNDKIKITYSGKANDLIKAYDINTFVIVEAID